MKETISNEFDKLPKEEKIPLMFDKCMKIMFANPNRLEPLTLLLSRILEIKYKDLVGHILIETPFLRNKALSEKKTKKDIIVKWGSSSPTDTKMLIEIYTNRYDSFIKKILYYLKQVFGRDLEEDRYNEFEKSVLINFNTFYTDLNNKIIFDTYYFRNKEGHILTKKAKVLCINIEGCYEAWYENNIPSFTNHYQKDLFYLCAAMYTKDNKEFEKFINEIRVGNDVKSVIKDVSRNMNNDNDLKIKYYNWAKEKTLINDSTVNEAKNIIDKV